MLAIIILLLIIFIETPVYSFRGESPFGAEENSDKKVYFDVRSDPPLLKGSKHTLFKSDSQVKSGNVSIDSDSEGNFIHFKKIESRDEGEYTIKISNGIGEGSKSFSLQVSP